MVGKAEKGIVCRLKSVAYLLKIKKLCILYGF